MKYLFKVYFSLLCLALWPSLTLYSPQIHAETIKVVTEYLEPYQIQNPDGSLGGFSTEVVRELFKITSDTPEIHIMPWARAYEIAKQEKNVMIFSIAHTKDRDNLFHWVGALKQERLYFWGLKSQFPNKDISFNHLKNYKVAASRKSNVADYLHSQKFTELYQLIKEDQNMQMLFKKRVDLIVATELTIQARAEKLGLDFNKLQKMHEVTKLNNDLSIAFNLQTSDEKVRKFQKALLTIKGNGVLSEIKAKWHIE